MTIRLDGIFLESEQEKGKAILQNLSTELTAGTITLLVGQTGAGKSSLLDVLTGLRPPHSGTVSYGGEPLWNGKRLNADVQAGIGVVFQYPEHQLFARTVEGEFLYSLGSLGLRREEMQARMRDALRSLGLPDTLASESPLTLSGGQKRRVALGTTFAADPRWLFLDEPTAGLDPQSTAMLVELLADWKKRAAEQGGGLVIATHDLDAFFPVADRVLVLQAGQIAAHCSPQELCADPSPLLQAGVGLPSSVQIAMALGDVGIEWPDGPLSAEEMADSIAREMKGKGNALSLESQHSSGKDNRFSESNVLRAHNDLSHHNSSTTAQAQIAATTLPPEPTRSLVHSLDPRSKWLFYVLLSTGILLQSSYLGIAVSTILTAAAFWLSRVKARQVLQVTKPFAFFLVFSVLLSGLRLGGTDDLPHLGAVGFAVDPALFTFRQVYNVLLVMILGVLLSATTSQLRMKRALEQSLGWLAGMKVPVEAFSLAMSLMLRFIPVILNELQRFSRIAKARGKSAAKTGALRLRDLRVMMIPLLMSMLQLGEDLSLAMEARGYRKMGQRRTSGIQLQMARRDWYAVLGGLLVFALLLAIP
jgi:energy-coupling factor transport system permease/ATP-binding protein